MIYKRRPSFKSKKNNDGCRDCVRNVPEFFQGARFSSWLSGKMGIISEYAEKVITILLQNISKSHTVFIEKHLLYFSGK